MAREVLAALTLAAAGCASLTPGGAKVAVFQPLPDSGPVASMPGGCRLRTAYPPVDMNERDMTTTRDPYMHERNRAAEDGANALLVRSRMIVPRLDYDCPAASPITDCPLSFGAWYRVVFEDYACSVGALSALESPPPR